VNSQAVKKSLMLSMTLMMNGEEEKRRERGDHDGICCSWLRAGYENFMHDKAACRFQLCEAVR
jgi:hypothetical protein